MERYSCFFAMFSICVCQRAGQAHALNSCSFWNPVRKSQSYYICVTFFFLNSSQLRSVIFQVIMFNIHPYFFISKVITGVRILTSDIKYNQGLILGGAKYHQLLLISMGVEIAQSLIGLVLQVAEDCYLIDFSSWAKH